MTETFRALLAAILPISPTLWLRLLLHWFVAKMALTLETHFEEFRDRPRSRAWFEAGIAYAEDGVAILTGQRTRVLMGRGFRLTRPWRKTRPSANPPSLARLLARWDRLLAALGDIERIARRRAARLMAERAADPLGLDPPDDDPRRVTIIIMPAAPLRTPDGLARRSAAKAAGSRASARGPPL